MSRQAISDEYRSDDASGALAGYANAGSFNNRGTNGNFWSSSESGANAWNRNLNSANATVNRNVNDKTNGLSVRCIQDSSRKPLYLSEWLSVLMDKAEGFFRFCHSGLDPESGSSWILSGFPLSRE